MKKLLFLLCSTVLLAPLALQAATPQAQEYDDLGLALYRQGFYAKAIPYFQNAVQADPQDWQGYENLGNCYFKINANTDALDAYQKSLKINPDNTTLENIIQSLQANATPVPGSSQMAQSSIAPPPPAGSTAPAMKSSVEAEEPIQNTTIPPTPSESTSTVIVTRRRANPVNEDYLGNPKDGLNPIDHSKFWAKFETNYNFSLQGDLNNSAPALNAESANGQLYTATWTGNATMSQSGLGAGAELGFLLDPYNGIAIGFRYIQSSDYVFNMADSMAATIGSNPNDFYNGTFTPYVVPITLDYYLFFPDKDGRTFLSVGGGYYAAGVDVSENYNFDNYYGSTGNVGGPAGTLTGGALGCEASIGREFAINRHVGLEVFVRGRYARITNLQGILSDGNNYELTKFSDGTVDIDSPAKIGTGGRTAAVLDFTGFDVGLSVNWYSF